MCCVLADGRTNYSTKFGIAESAKLGISSIKVFTYIKTIPQFEDNENKMREILLKSYVFKTHF